MRCKRDGLSSNNLCLDDQAPTEKLVKNPAQDLKMVRG